MSPEPDDGVGYDTWLRRAHSKLARAQAGRIAPQVLYEDCCFDAQQAAEKAIKAVLVARRVDFPKTHSISRLLDIAAHAGLTVPPDVRDASSLTTFATDARYPGPSEPITAVEYSEAVRLAEGTVKWAEHAAATGAD